MGDSGEGIQIRQGPDGSSKVLPVPVPRSPKSPRREDRRSVFRMPVPALGSYHPRPGPSSSPHARQSKLQRPRHDVVELAPDGEMSIADGFR